ncbi:MAG: DUF2029 domain-containing protein [bacterium]|nr:DUF2029 domain-containing protein [bacterium]
MKRPPDWLLAILLVTGVYLWQRTAFPLWMIDLLPIQLAAHQWEQGDIENIYAPVAKFDEWYKTCEPQALSLGGEGFGNPYFYPPFVAASLAPVSSAHALVWRNVLFSINVLLIFVNAWFVLCLTGAERTRRNILWCLAFALLCFPLSRATKLGQIVPLLAAVTWLGLLWLRSEKQRLAGITLGVVAAVKLFPVGFLILPALTRRWKTLLFAGIAVIAIASLSILVLGLRVHELFWQAVTEFRTLVYAFQGNQSLTGWYVRLAYEFPLLNFNVPFSDEQLDLAKLIILALVALPTVVWLFVYRAGYSRGSFPAFAGVLMAGIMLAMSNSWEHYWLWLLPVLGWAIHEEWTHNESHFRLYWILIASFFFLMKLTRFYTESDPGRIISGSQTVGMIMLWLWLFYRVRRAALSE